MITFKEFLCELFDKPWETTHDEHMTKLFRAQKESYWPGEDVKAINAYKIEGNNGHILHFHRKGFFEVHHIDHNGESGQMIHKKSTNSRYIGTMIHHIKKHGLEKGYGVRINSLGKMSKHYDKMVDKLIDKKTHNITKTKDGEHDSIEIRHNSPIQKILEDLRDRKYFDSVKEVL